MQVSQSNAPSGAVYRSGAVARLTGHPRTDAARLGAALQDRRAAPECDGATPVLTGRCSPAHGHQAAGRFGTCHRLNRHARPRQLAVHARQGRACIRFGGRGRSVAGARGDRWRSTRHARAGFPSARAANRGCNSECGWRRRNPEGSDGRCPACGVTDPESRIGAGHSLVGPASRAAEDHRRVRFRHAAHRAGVARAGLQPGACARGYRRAGIAL